MKRAKRFKKFMAMIVAGTMVAATVLVASAGKCTHGGENPTYEVYSSYKVDCISTGTHPCYVGGVLTSCETYVYKFINHTRCNDCSEPGPSHFSYSAIPYHEYVH